MKTFYFFIALAMGSLMQTSLSAQQHTLYKKTDRVSVKTLYEQTLQLSCDFTYQYYYDSNDKPVKNGSYKISGSNSDKDNALYRTQNYKKVSFVHGWNQKYTETGNFKDNYYDGIIKMNCSQNHTKNGTQVAHRQLNVIMNYNQGHPTGTWTFEEKGNGLYGSFSNIEAGMVDLKNAYKENYSVKITATFTDGNITKYVCKGYSHDDCNITFDSDGLPSGTVGDYNLRRGVMINKVSHSDGYVDANPEEKQLIERYINGEISGKELVGLGYALNVRHFYESDGYSLFLRNRLRDYMTNNGSWHQLEYFVNKRDLDSIYNRLTFGCTYLGKAKMATFEMIKREIDRDIGSCGSSDYKLMIRVYDNWEEEIKDITKITFGGDYYITSNLREEASKYIKEKKEQTAALQRERNAKELKRHKELAYENIHGAIKVTPISSAKEGDVINLVIDYNIVNETEVKEVTCHFDKLNRSPWGYSSYEFTSKPYRYDIREAYSHAKKINNIWDTIKLTGEKIKNIDTLLSGFLSGDQYKNDLIQYKLFRNEISLKNYIDINDAPKSLNSLNELYDIYSKYYQYASKKKSYLANNTILERNDDNTMKDILKAYFRYDKGSNVDLTIYPIIDSALIAIEKKLMEQTCVQGFMIMRRTILDNDEKIDNYKDGKNLVKIYNKYFKEYDREWAPGNDVNVRAAEVIAIQTKIMNALERADIKDLNSRVKEEKCKTMDCLLLMLE